MPMSLLTAQGLVEGYLGRLPPAHLPAATLVHLAWEALLAHRTWHWASGTRVEIALVANQARYALPDNLGKIVLIHAPNDWVNPVQMATWSQLEELRSRGYSALLGTPPYHGAIRWDADEAGAYRPELELYPVPTTSGGLLEVSYIPAAGTRAPEDLHLAYPHFMDPLWHEWLRAYSLGMVEHDSAGVTLRLNDVMQGPLWVAAIHRDVGPNRIKRPGPGAADEYVDTFRFRRRLRP